MTLFAANLSLVLSILWCIGNALIFSIPVVYEALCLHTPCSADEVRIFFIPLILKGQEFC